MATRAVRVRTLGGISCETVTGPARAALEQDLSPAGFGGGAPIFEIKSVDSPPCYVFKGQAPRRQTCHIHCKNCGLATQASKSIVKTDTWRSQPPSKNDPEFFARISPQRRANFFLAPQVEGGSRVRTIVKMEASWPHHHKPL